MEVPSPVVYNPVIAKKDGKTSSSKLHSTILGWAGLMKKSPRFETDQNGILFSIKQIILGRQTILQIRSILKANQWAGASAAHYVTPLSIKSGNANSGRALETTSCLPNSDTTKDVLLQVIKLSPTIEASHFYP
jgi:hypothetical protein